jgi:hypothetical protein
MTTLAGACSFYMEGEEMDLSGNLTEFWWKFYSAQIYLLSFLPFSPVFSLVDLVN